MRCRSARCSCLAIKRAFLSRHACLSRRAASVLPTHARITSTLLSPLLTTDNMTARYTGLADCPDDDDDFGLGDDDDEAKVLGESLHEYALGVTEMSQPGVPGGADLISIDSGENSDSTSLLQPPRPHVPAPPVPSVPVPTLAPPPPRK